MSEKPKKTKIREKIVFPETSYGQVEYSFGIPSQFFSKRKPKKFLLNVQK